MISHDLRRLQQSEIGVEVAGSQPGDSVHSVYTTRACDELAFCLMQEIPGSEFVGVWYINDDVRYLVHAGVELNGRVFDIDGCSNLEDWFHRWSGPFESVELVFGTEHLEDSQINRFKKAREVASALVTVPELSDVLKPSMVM